MIELNKTNRFAVSFAKYNHSHSLAEQFNEMASEIDTIVGYVSEVESNLSECQFYHSNFVKLIARGQKLIINARRWRDQLRMINRTK